MRCLLLLSVTLLSACNQDLGQQSGQDVEAGPQLAVYSGEGRDRLCLDERAGRIGFVTYGQGDNNCSIRASVSRKGKGLSIAPDGDQSCSISATVADGSVILGERSPACAYYCGPGATFAGKRFARLERAEPVTDFAGEPLC